MQKVFGEFQNILTFVLKMFDVLKDNITLTK